VERGRRSLGRTGQRNGTPASGPVDNLARLAEMDINPFMAFLEAKDFRAVDCRVRLAEK
jgi:hypothetical protein